MAKIEYSNMYNRTTKYISNSVLNVANGCTNTNNQNYNRIGFYNIIGTIGHGNFAVCKLAQHTLTNTLVAIKFIDKTNLDATNLKRIYKEIEIMKCVNHPNIIKLYQVIESKTMLYLVCEYATNGEIFDYISRNGAMSEKMACEKFCQIISAVEYCHKKNIVHRDLKSENLLLDCNMNIKLADFGFANYYDMINPLKTFCGSAPYAAPEVFCGQQYFGPEIDIWSLGVILYVLVCGRLPFNGDNIQQLKQRVLAGKYALPCYISKACEDLISRILVIDPKTRYTLDQIKQHPWITSNNGKFQEATTLQQNNNTSVVKQQNNLNSSITESSTFKKCVSLNSIFCTNNNTQTRKETTNNNNKVKSQYYRSQSINELYPKSNNNKNLTYFTQLNKTFIDNEILNLMKSLGLDTQLAINSINQNLFDNFTAIYRFLKENQEKLKKSSSYKLSLINNNNNAGNNDNDISIKRKEIINNSSNYFHGNIGKKLIKYSLSVDEGVESDLSSPAQSDSFSNDILSSSINNSQPLAYQLQYSKNNYCNENYSSSSASSTPISSSFSNRSQLNSPNYGHSHHSSSRKQLYDNSCNSSNNNKPFNPYDFYQVKKELKKLIKTNRTKLPYLNRKNINYHQLTYNSNNSMCNYNANVGCLPTTTATTASNGVVNDLSNSICNSNNTTITTKNPINCNNMVNTTNSKQSENMNINEPKKQENCCSNMSNNPTTTTMPITIKSQNDNNLYRKTIRTPKSIKRFQSANNLFKKSLSDTLSLNRKYSLK